MTVFPTLQFKKKSEKLPKKVKRALAECLALFISDPHHQLLNNHQLDGSRRHQRSFNVTGDRRVIFEEVSADVVRLLDIDTHTTTSTAHN